MQDCPAYLEGSSKVCLFTYDNNTLIVHSFLAHPSRCNLVVNQPSARLYDLLADEEIGGDVRGSKTVFKVSVQPHSYRVFKFK